MNIRKALAALALTASMIVWASAAYGLDQENNTTGSDSTNHNHFDARNDVDVDIDNDADVDADFDQDADTGGNDVKDNTTVDNVSTGNASGSVMFDVTVNQNSGGGNSWDPAAWMAGFASSSQTNDTTGSDSDNQNTIDLRNDVDIDISNDADVDIDYDCDADTGGNDVQDNTTVGDVSTGDASCTFDGSVSITQSG